MTNAGYYQDQNLQVMRITDFTPGIVRFSRGGFTGSPGYPSTYATSAPVGSAADAHRCMGIRNIGLIPFCVYRPVSSYIRPAQSIEQIVTVGNIGSLSAFWSGGSPLGGRQYYGDDLIQIFINQWGSNFYLDVTRVNVPAPTWDTNSTNAVSSILNHMSTAVPTTVMWPTLDYALWYDNTSPTDYAYRKTVLFTHPYAYQWVTVGSWNSPSYPTPPPPYSTGPLPSPAAYTPRVFYHGARAGVLHATTPLIDSSGWGGAAQDTLGVSNILDPTTWNQSGYYYAEMGNSFAVWGSISTGELFLLYNNGGAVLLYGDTLAPSSAYKLPGVVGPGNAWGKGALTPAGLIYATDSHGAYSWNGDNASVRISTQIPDDVLYRSPPPQPFFYDSRYRTSQLAWGNWVMFPNNWLYDTESSSWWQVEDQDVVNFQVFAGSNRGPMAFYAVPGWAIAPAGQACELITYGFDRTTPQSSYFWLSNPLPVTQGALVTLATVELVASNTTPYDCTIVVTPTVPEGQIPLQQQSQNQAMTYVVPANTVGWRGSQRCGYADYNVQLQVDAANRSAGMALTTAYAAPTLHEITIAYQPTRPAGIQ